MTPRLQAVCALIRPCDLLADVGCDHGYVARYALENGVRSVIASDIAIGALQKARVLLAPYGSRVTTVCADGLDALAGQNPDCIVIAGMGGKNIIDILSGYTGDAALILGPQRDVPQVRQYLTEHGYKITFDSVVEDRRRFYDVLRVERGEQTLDRFQRQFGVFYRQKNQALQDKLLRERSLRQGYGADTADITEVLQWQQR